MVQVGHRWLINIESVDHLHESPDKVCQFLCLIEYLQTILLEKNRTVFKFLEGFWSVSNIQTNWNFLLQQRSDQLYCFNPSQLVELPTLESGHVGNEDHVRLRALKKLLVPIDPFKQFNCVRKLKEDGRLQVPVHNRLLELSPLFLFVIDPANITRFSLIEVTGLFDLHQLVPEEVKTDQQLTVCPFLGNFESGVGFQQDFFFEGIARKPLNRSSFFGFQGQEYVFILAADIFYLFSVKMLLIIFSKSLF